MPWAWECSGRDAVAWRESLPAAQRTHYSDVTKTQYGVSCTGQA